VAIHAFSLFTDDQFITAFDLVSFPIICS
jgi:hypothetical protein